ncbi:phosphoglycerate dehydrogenase [Treponema sp. OMZ 840]|uniref:phosphoglycerate dehydrogenase n=1 Tax=Treponema sp. OMZ 840 TaxID=244313 RepID=UPI003D8D8F33
MNTYTVLATPRSFAAKDDAPIKLLEQNGCRVIRLNPAAGNLREQLLEHLPSADAVIAGLENYDKELIAAASKLKIISRYGVGYDNVDLKAAAQAGIKVSITPGANSNSVADMAITLMLCAARNICPMDAAVRAGKKEKPVSGVEMWEKTLGVVGTGKIGKGVIERASGFRMNILASDTYKDTDFIDLYKGKYVDIDTLFKQSDFISLHVPLTDETKNIVNKKRLSLMKPRAVLVNTARGGLIDEDALYTALKEGSIGAAALDVLARDNPEESPLRTLDNCIITPHAGAATAEASYNMGMTAAQNVIDVLGGKTCTYLVEPD